MTTIPLNERIDIWERSLDRIALEIDAHGVEGEKLIPIYQRVEQALGRDLERKKAMGSVSARLKRLNGQTAKQSSPAGHAAK